MITFLFLNINMCSSKVIIYFEIVELADPEISKNAFERTLLMEERTMVLKQMQEARSGGVSQSRGVSVC